MRRRAALFVIGVGDWIAVIGNVLLPDPADPYAEHIEGYAEDEPEDFNEPEPRSHLRRPEACEDDPRDIAREDGGW